MSDSTPLARRRFLRYAAFGGLGLALARLSPADDRPPADPGDTATDFITPETQAAIDRGLASLGRSQGDDGAYFDERSGANVAITALAGLALMAGGHQPGRGRFGANVSRAMDYVLARANGPTPGYLSAAEPGPNHSGMYQHGFGALFLSEGVRLVPGPAR